MGPFKNQKGIFILYWQNICQLVLFDFCEKCTIKTNAGLQFFFVILPAGGKICTSCWIDGDYPLMRADDRPS
jgi:hypothetical protein